MSDNSTNTELIKEVRIAIDWALGKGHLLQLSPTQLNDAATAVVNRLGLSTQPPQDGNGAGDNDVQQVIGRLKAQIWT